MIIKSVRLRNIRSYNDSLIEFSKGSTLLSGDIGSGKSSILLGIEFALFGTKKTSLASSSLLRNGAKSGSVELNFEIDNKEVVIGRFLKRINTGIKQDNGFITINEVKTEFSPTELRARIYGILGYPSDMLGKGDDLIYRFTVYTPQEEMKSILFKDPEARIETLRKVFDIDKYRRITNNTSIVAKKIREEIKVLEARSEGINERLKNASELNEKIGRIKKELIEIKKSEEEKKTIIEKIKQELIELEDKIKKFKESVKEIEISRIRIKDKENLIFKKTQEISAIKLKVDSLANNLEILKNNIEPQYLDKEKELDKEKLEIETKIRLIDSERKKTSDSIKFYKKIISDNEKQSAELNKKINLINIKKQKIPELLEFMKDKEKILNTIEQVNSQISQIKALDIQSAKTLQEFKKSLDNISSLKDCPLCLQKVDDTHKNIILNDLNRKMESVNDESQKRRIEMQSKNQEYLRLKQRYDEMIKKEKELQIIEKEISSEALVIDEINKRKKESSEYNLELKKIEGEHQKSISIKTDELKKQSEEISKKLEGIRNIRMINLEISQSETLRILQEKSIIEADSEILKLNDEINSLKHHAEELALNNEKLLEKKKARENNLEILKNLEVSRAKFETELFSIQRNLDSLNNEIKEKQEYIIKRDKLSNDHEWLQKKFIPLIDNIEKHVMSRIHGEFSELLDKWFGLLVEDENIRVRLDDEFTPILEQNGYETELSNLSGGEKTSLALAYRLALNKVVNDIVSNIKTKNIIILDEPTDGFSAEQLDKLKDVIHELSMDQIIIVSHEHKIETFVDTVIRVSKDQHISQVH